jgi:hypothetical protein
MSVRRRIAIIGVVLVLVSTLVMGGLLWVWSPGVPRPFLDDAGRPVAGSISEKIWVDINGVQQGMVIRGKNVANPLRPRGCGVRRSRRATSRGSCRPHRTA